MTMDDWRRQLLVLEQEEREARAVVRAGNADPHQSEQAYNALRQAEAALDEHYTIRPR